MCACACLFLYSWMFILFRFVWPHIDLLFSSPSHRSPTIFFVDHSLSLNVLCAQMCTIYTHACHVRYLTKFWRNRRRLNQWMNERDGPNGMRSIYTHAHNLLLIWILFAYLFALLIFDLLLIRSVPPNCTSFVSCLCVFFSRSLFLSLKHRTKVYKRTHTSRHSHLLKIKTLKRQD